MTAQILQIEVPEPINLDSDWLERLLNGALWKRARSQGTAKAFKDLSRMFPNEFNRLLSEAMTRFEPKGSITVKALPIRKP